MSMTDPIADFITQIRNANDAKLVNVEIPASNIKFEMAKILKEEGFIKDAKLIEDNKQGLVRIKLKYTADQDKVITGLKRISKPGLRIYANAEEVPKVLNGLGIAIISTSEGIITDRVARAKNIGGEVLAYIW
ncbi:MAG: 30S ribosomal protein S8 [Atopostipes sp.]|nr:30S ribosomal protein S8 [Staphylococcus equorum]MDN6161699.1 30S ribosomal protein S8 [Atopostipes sp.]